MSEKTNEELAAIIDDVAKLLTEAGAVALREAAARLRQQSEDSARLDWMIRMGAQWIALAGFPGDLEWTENGKVQSQSSFCPRYAIDKARS